MSSVSQCLLQCFQAGSTLINPAIGSSIKTKVKVVGAGVALYYLANFLKDYAVNIPLKLFRGVDMNQYARTIVSLRAKTAGWSFSKKSGISPGIYKSRLGQI